MGVQKISSKWSSTSSHMSVTKPIWTPHGRPKDVLKVIVYQFLLDWYNTCLNTPLGVQKMSSNWSSTSPYLCVTKPIWTPHGRPQDVINVIAYQFLFDWHNTCLNTPWTSKWCPQRDPLQVHIWVSQPYLNTPWTCKRCPQSDRLPVPIWLRQHLLENPMDVQKMSSKWSSTSSYLSDPVLFGHPLDVQKMSSKGSSSISYLTDTNPFWTPHGRA